MLHNPSIQTETGRTRNCFDTKTRKHIYTSNGINVTMYGCVSLSSEYFTTYTYYIYIVDITYHHLLVAFSCLEFTEEIRFTVYYARRIDYLIFYASNVQPPFFPHVVRHKQGIYANVFKEWKCKRTKTKTKTWREKLMRCENKCAAKEMEKYHKQAFSVQREWSDGRTVERFYFQHVSGQNQHQSNVWAWMVVHMAGVYVCNVWCPFRRCSDPNPIRLHFLRWPFHVWYIKPNARFTCVRVWNGLRVYSRFSIGNGAMQQALSSYHSCVTLN